MKILVMGTFPDETQKRINSCFPKRWEVHFSDTAGAHRYLHDTDVIIPEHIRIDKDILDKAPKLKMIQTGAGYDSIDLEECAKRGVTVCNASGVNANAVAEHTIALLLSFYKNIPYLDSMLKNHADEKAISYSGCEVRGKTIGIIGFGAIGKIVAGLCTAFGMKVTAYTATPGKADGVIFSDLNTLLKTSDVVSLHVPANKDTFHLIDSNALKLMKQSALLINTSRGSTVDEKALVEALCEKRIAGACLDVFEDEPLAQSSILRDLDNVILTPHTAGFPDGLKYHRNRYCFFAENISRLEKNETPQNIVRN